MVKDTILHTLVVALLVCLFCSLMVSVPAVLLKPAQVANADYNRRVNILLAAGALERKQVNNKQLVAKLFSQIKESIVNLDTGKISALDPAQFDIKKVLADKTLSLVLDKKQDIAGIKRRENLVKIYTSYKGGKLDKIILPIRGYGLWSTLYGLIALESDLNTVKGLIFYKHAETPGLGGEVDNIAWQNSWRGKQLFDSRGKLQLQLIKGGVNTSLAASLQAHQVDALAGATLTSRGINNLLTFWFSERGFNKFLISYKEQI